LSANFERKFLAWILTEAVASIFGIHSDRPFAEFKFLKMVPCLIGTGEIGSRKEIGRQQYLVGYCVALERIERREPASLGDSLFSRGKSIDESGYGRAEFLPHSNLCFCGSGSYGLYEGDIQSTSFPFAPAPSRTRGQVLPKQSTGGRERLPFGFRISQAEIRISIAKQIDFRKFRGWRMKLGLANSGVQTRIGNRPTIDLATPD